jgi:hypothetical protein
MTAAGTVAGLAVAWRMPVRYSSETLFRLDNTTPERAARIVGAAVRRGPDRGLTWQRVDPGSTFRLRYVAGTSEQARGVVLDLLGAVDHKVVGLSGAGAAVGNLEETAMPARQTAVPDPYAVNLSVSVARTMPAPGYPSDIPRLVPMGASTQLEVPVAAAIPFDDERARPVARPEYRNIRLIVIDQPAVQSKPEGIGWIALAVGAAAGMLLAVFANLLGSAKTSKSPDLAAGAF